MMWGAAGQVWHFMASLSFPALLSQDTAPPGELKGGEQKNFT
jgi:hypothetical protein